MATAYGGVARYRRVIADEFLDEPRAWTVSRPCVVPVAASSGDRTADASILPGTALVFGPDRTAAQELAFPASAQRVHGGPTRTFARAGANQSGPIYIADINTLAGRDMYDVWGFDSVTGIFWDQARALNVLVPTGVNITKGVGLTTNTVGWFVPATAGQRVIMIADETFNNNTGIYQHVRAFPAPGA